MMEHTTTLMLEDFMDPDYGLLDFLLASETLSRREIQDIKSGSTTFVRNGKLLSYIEAKAALEELKSALAHGNQMHLVNFINSNGVHQEEYGDDWPLSKNDTRILDFNHGQLVDLIDPKELIDKLLAKKIINSRQHRILKCMTNEILQNEMLIEIWSKTSRKNFYKVVECLNKCGQSHIGDIFKHGGAIFKVHITMYGEEERVDSTEDQIVNSMKNLLKEKTLDERTRIMELLQLGNDDVQLISARKSSSIALYFHCRTLQGLTDLHNLVSSGRLKTIVEAAFNEILRSCDAATFSTVDEDTFVGILQPDDETGVFTIRWSTDEFNKYKAFLQEDFGSMERKESSSKPFVAKKQRVLYEETKCCICTQTFNNPRSLPCLHTFCRKCIDHWAENKSPGERIGCPVCRQQYKIPVDGIDGFPRNNLMDKLIEIGNNSGNTSEAVPCDICNDYKEGPNAVIPVAIKHCIECQQNMCKECAHHHSRQRLFRCHELINLEGLEETERAKITSSTCDKHPRKPMVIYCLNCQTTICQICFDESHGGHKSEEVRDVAKMMERDLDDVAVSMANLAAELTVIKTEDPQTSFLNRVSATEIDVRDRSEKVKLIVESHRDRLLEYLNNVVKSRIQKEYGAVVYDLEIHLGAIGNVIQIIQDLKAQGSISDITGIGPSLLARAQELQQNHQILCTKLKSQRTWPNTDLVPVDIDDLLSYNSGNLVGKIKVNIIAVNDDGDNDHYEKFDTDVYADDAYADCAYQPVITDTQSEISDNRPDIDNKPEYEETEGYTQLSSDTDDSPDDTYDSPDDTDDSPEKQAPPLPLRVKTSTGNSRENEIRPSKINLERKLRTGKYTEIWLGKLNQVGDVAVKTFTDETHKESWIVKSCDFFQEADILQELQHENIVRLIGVHSLGEPFYVITETTSKGYLDHYLRQDKGVTIKLKDIINMAKQITSAMHYLEVNHCIHRYLAAKSILVGEDNSIKLTNFEMARIVGNSREHLTTFTDTYELLESPIKTRAPEVIESQRWSIKSDVWSFGIVLYEMLTYGADPYPEMDSTGLIRCVLELYEVPRPAGNNFTHPEKKLLKILQCCWIKDPFKRPDFKYLFGFFKGYFAGRDTENLMGYLRSPDLVTSIRGRGAVTGVTVYNDKIYVTRDDSTKIETYLGSNFKRGQYITIGEKSKPSRIKVFMSKASKLNAKQNGLQDLTCDRWARLYTSEGNGYRIFCIDVNTREVISCWQMEAAKPSGLSVTKDGHLLVSCAIECKICEYTFRGELVHEISFGCNMDDGPRHALQYGSDLLVVCHGNTGASQKRGDGVSVIDLYGNISLGTKTMQLVNSSHLAVDSHQQILIADRARNVIILANPTLDGSHRILLMSDNKLEAPTRIHLNEDKGLLLVGLQSGALMIYCVKSPSSISDDAAKRASAGYDDYTPLYNSTCIYDSIDSIYDIID